jgi:hypothetical protein
MIMKYTHIIYLAFAILATACEDKEINWKVDHVDQMLVVEGSFTDEYKKHQLILTLSEDYFVNRHTTRISDATVSITDGANTYNYVETSPGIYETADPVAGVIGMNYTLNIDLNKPVNGTTHYYSSSVMKPTIKIDSLKSYVFRNPITGEGDSLILIFEVFGKEKSPKGDYYASEIYINNTQINDTIDKQLVYNDETDGLDGNDVNYFFIFSNSIRPGDTTRFSLLSVNRSYQEFVTGIQNIAEYNDPMGFSGPPANAIGNIQGGKALGFFLISSVGTGIAIVKDER